MVRVSKWVVVLAVLVMMLGISAAVYATPTGLNNIPTADVVAKDVLVLQGFGVFGEERSPDWFLGAKYGPAKNVEVGIDGRVAGEGGSSGLTFQAKYRVPLDKQTRVAAGIANLSTDTDRNGDNFPYLVVSHNFNDCFNGHLGYSFESDNQAWFAGVDKALSKAFVLRSDWIQVNDGDDSLFSLGGIYTISPNWLVEGWASFPTADGDKTSFVAKVNYVIPLK